LIILIRNLFHRGEEKIVRENSRSWLQLLFKPSDLIHINELRYGGSNFGDNNYGRYSAGFSFWIDHLPTQSSQELICRLCLLCWHMCLVNYVCIFRNPYFDLKMHVKMSYLVFMRTFSLILACFFEVDVHIPKSECLIMIGLSCTSTLGIFAFVNLEEKNNHWAYFDYFGVIIDVIILIIH